MAAAVAGGGIFVALAATVARRAPGAFDLTAWRLAGELRTPAGVSIAAGLSFFGTGWGLAAVAAALTIYLLAWRRDFWALAPAVIMGLAAAVMQVTKDVVSRPRPPAPVFVVPGWSYPSGHSTATAALAVAAWLLLGRSRRWRWLLLLYPLLVGASRVYLRAHWATDVLGGWSLGVAVVALAVAANPVPQPRRRRRSRAAH